MKSNPFTRLGGSSKAWLAALGIVAIVVLPILSTRPWQELAVVVGGITYLLTTLIDGISREDAAAKSVAPSTLNVGNVERMDARTEAKPAEKPVEKPVEKVVTEPVVDKTKPPPLPKTIIVDETDLVQSVENRMRALQDAMAESGMLFLAAARPGAQPTLKKQKTEPITDKEADPE